MLCEMCGKDVPATRPMMVERTRLNLCPGCARFGNDYVAPDSSGSRGTVSQSVIEERLQKRERRMQTRDVYSKETTMELVEDYGSLIREAREAKGMDLDQFAASILEKRGILAKIEANDLIPDDKISAKIEKALGIKLREPVQTGSQIGGGNRSDMMTLSHFIKKE